MEKVPVQDPRGAAQPSPSAFLAGLGGPDSSVLEAGLAMGEAIAGFLRTATAPRLAPSNRAAVERHVAAAAAHGAYAGLSLWALATLSGGHPGARRLAAAITGVSVGMLDKGRSVAGRN